MGIADRGYMHAGGMVVEVSGPRSEHLDHHDVDHCALLRGLVRRRVLSFFAGPHRFEMGHCGWFCKSAWVVESWPSVANGQVVKGALAQPWGSSPRTTA